MLTAALHGWPSPSGDEGEDWTRPVHEAVQHEGDGLNPGDRHRDASRLPPA